MPTVPEQQLARRQTRDPQFQAQAIDPATGTAGARALAAGAARLAPIFERRAQERDMSQARNAFNDFRRTARNQINTLQLRRGKDAYGVQGEYDEWYSTTTSNAATGLENDRQREVFNQLASSKFESDANTMGAFSVSEHFRYVESVYQDTVATAIAEAVQDPFNEGAITAEVEGVSASLEAARPGMDNGAEFERARAKIILAAIQSQVSANPLRAKDTVAQYKDELGGAYPKVKDQVDSEAILAEAGHIFPESFDDRYDFIQGNKEISDRVRFTALNRVNSLRTEQESREKEAKQEARLESMNEIFAALNQGDNAGADAFISGLDTSDNFTEKEKYQLRNLTKSGTFKTDPLAEQGLELDIRRGKITTESQLLDDPRLTKLRAESMRGLFSQLEKNVKDPKAVAQAKSVNHAITLSEQRFDKVFKGTEFESLKSEYFSILNNEISLMETEKGRPLNVQEVTKIGRDLLAEETEERSFFGIDLLARDVTRRRIELLFPEAVEEAEAAAAAEPQRAAGRVQELRGVPRTVAQEILAAEGVQPVQVEQLPQTDPLAPWVDKMPSEVRGSITKALTDAGRKLYYRDIWKLYSDRFPEEAKRIEQSEGL